MSGTSLDGIDAALIELRPRGGGYALKLLRSRTLPFTTEQRERILAMLAPHEPSPREAAELDVELGKALGEAAQTISAEHRIDYVASHGLTLYHDGAHRLSVQIGNPFVIRELVGVTVVADFRRADCAAGGEGAPLVPYVDALLFADEHMETVALNVGGIANLTLVPRAGLPHDVRAWDCGPGNMLLDAFVRERTQGAQTYDPDGKFARAGNLDANLLEAMLADEYFAKLPPKSTGRERFGASFLTAHRERLDALSLEDGCATLLELTLEAVARDIGSQAARDARIVVSGGGARNVRLLERLRERLNSRCVLRSDEVGIDADMKEAMAFAMLGYETLRGRPAGLWRVTGARYGTVLGSIAPVALDALLTKVECEVRQA
jgi:anhydro-N-acetylmuramic acid kinase